ncbi:DUF4910 domain-containing protein [Thalassospira sp.]|uniref:DUF4910 domain-containing protein n=1 Tax=Thalassospira sp. TaxID=1912094 RepID=UPI001B003E52|nr:DUF4910 domain-containing protein [Thalassospira sp.]MBO6805951.1 DUF4910 domain-containing protein [Thalassospira sp.]
MKNLRFNGAYLHAVVSELFPICRSITGQGVRRSFQILGDRFLEARLHEVPTGTKCFDWEIPDEWSIAEAYLVDPDGEVVVDFNDNNLHVVNYSVPVDKVLPLEELQNYLYSVEDKPDAIPYVTSYYKRSWGFCLQHAKRESLRPGNYHAVIKSKHEAGALTYGEMVIPGESKQEVLISSYICHPSMANNELSGPVVAFALAKWLTERQNRYTYRIAVFPETIGAICYISRNLKNLKDNVIAGFQLSCIGDDRSYSFLSSPNADTLADRVARHVYKNTDPNFVEYDFLERGSDERQFCAPKVGLPVVTLMRTKFGAFPEYHTSLDDLSLVSATGLQKGFEVASRCIEALEVNKVYVATHYCEPRLSKYGLRNTTSHITLDDEFKLVSDVLAFADGKRDLIDLSERVGRPIWDVCRITSLLDENGLLQEC